MTSHPAHPIDVKDRARERTATLESILKGSEGGATAEIEQSCYEAEAILQKRAKETGSRPVLHAAEFVKAQRELVRDKDLGDRFLRITRRLDQLREHANLEDVKRIQKEVDDLRPLLRLTIRSSDFRTTLMSILSVSKHLLEEKNTNQLDLDSVLYQKHRRYSLDEERLEIIHPKVSKHQKLLDKDWHHLSHELDKVFRTIHQHEEFRDGIERLFDLGTIITSKARSTIVSLDEAPHVQKEKKIIRHKHAHKHAHREPRTEVVTEERREVVGHEGPTSTAVSDDTLEIQREAIDLVAQFSGEHDLNKLLHSIRRLMEEVGNNKKAKVWWSHLRDHTLHVVKDYQGIEDVEEFRQIFDDGLSIFRHHKKTLTKIVDRMRHVVDNISHDTYVNKLRESLSMLADDLTWQDANGHRFVDAEAAGILVESISEVIRQEFKYLAIPHISHTEGKTSFTVDDLVINAHFPQKIDLHLESNATIDTVAIEKSGLGGISALVYLTAHINGINATARDMKFSYNSSLIHEKGMIKKVDILGANLTIDFLLRPTAGALPGASDTHYDFLRTESHFHISDMRIKYARKTLTHRFLVPLVTNLFHARLVHRIENGVKEALDEALHRLGQQVTGLLNQQTSPLSISKIVSVI